MRNAMLLTRRNPARFLAVSLGIALAFLSTTARARETALTAILSGLEQVRKLQPMDNRKQYELEVSGSRVTAFPDDFLRRRTPAEILKSGLSAGAGTTLSPSIPWSNPRDSRRSTLTPWP